MVSFILASGSPRRKDLLQLAQIEFEILISDTQETYPSTLLLEEVPSFIAKQKAMVVCEKMKTNQIQIFDKCIIAADTIVVLENLVMGKPVDRNDAIASLTKLSGTTHKVITGICLLFNDKVETFSETTLVEFHPLTNEQIIYYVDHFKPYDKAGSYAIQEWIGVIGIKSIQGDFYNVMGLPVSKLVQKLKQLALL